LISIAERSQETDSLEIEVINDNREERKEGSEYISAHLWEIA